MTGSTGRAPIGAADVRTHIGGPWPLPGDGDTWRRWQLLAAVAADDLPLAKLVEPHYDAVAILHELAGPAAAPGEIWAVWAAEPPFAVLTATPEQHGWRLSGSKAFCSGVDLVTHALVTAEAPDGPRLFAVDLAADGIRPGGGPAWTGAGMRRARTGTLDLVDVAAEPVGEPGEYVDRPGFWMGAIGVAACWWGGARGVASTLEQRSAGLDAHGLAHLGAVRSALDVAGLALEAAAGRLDRHDPQTSDPQTSDPQTSDPRTSAERLAQSVRAHVAGVVETTLAHVGRALGPAPLAFDARHAEHVADLEVFVRQHHAERDLERLGSLADADRQEAGDA